MPLTDLGPGHQFEPFEVQLGPEEVAAYVNAVGDESPVARSKEWIPPTALLARGLRVIIQALELGGGTIHASQDANFLRPIRIGEPIFGQATLEGNSVRRGSRFATVRVEFTDAAKRIIATTTSTVIVPA